MFNTGQGLIQDRKRAEAEREKIKAEAKRATNEAEDVLREEARLSELDRKAEQSRLFNTGQELIKDQKREEEARERVRKDERKATQEAEDALREEAKLFEIDRKKEKSR